MSDTQKSFYITSTLPYVNSEPHIGFAIEIIRTDVIARYKRAQGYTVFFNTGTDEHGAKIYEQATKNGITPQAHVDHYVQAFYRLGKALNLETTRFIRTTDPDHVEAAQEFWRRCKANGDIYFKNYKAKYCIGCELERHDSELDASGRCFLHPNLEIQIIEEENYFFRFSKYQQALLDLYKNNPNFVIPDFRFNEIKAFVERGLEDFSISRLKSKMPWGIQVPDDENHVMYVWFDALVNYISTLGWPNHLEKFEQFWAQGTPVQYCGKDNLRQQSAMWQAMLLSAKLPTSHTIVIDGFITGAGGLKMSKSLGNVVSPFDVVDQYGTDALRYYVLREVSPFEDSPFTPELFKDAYNGNLANGIGNLTSRIMKMATTHLTAPVLSKIEATDEVANKAIADAVARFDLKAALDVIFKQVGEIDAFIQKEQPFKVIKVDQQKGIDLIKELVMKLAIIAKELEPFLPATAAAIQALILEHKMPETPLFVRKD